MKKHKLLRRITALVLVLTLTFSCLSITSYAVPIYQDPRSPIPSLTWPKFTYDGGQSSYYNRGSSSQSKPTSTTEGLKPIDPKTVAQDLHKTLKDMGVSGSGQRDDNSFLEKVKTEYVKSKIPTLIKEAVKAGTKKVGKWIDKGINGAKNWLNKGKAGVNWFSKIMGKAAEKWAGRLLYLKGMYDFIKDPSAPFLSPYLRLCAMGIKGFNTFVGPFLPPKVALAMTAAEVIFTSSEMVNLINDLYIKLLNSDGPLKYSLLLPDFIIMTLYLGGKMVLDFLVPFIEKYTNAVDLAASPDAVLKDLQKKQKGASPTANGIGVYKPNIYLYPTEAADIGVTFKQPELLTVTDPPYGSGWNVTAAPDGALNTQSGEYGYLFYESVTFPSYYQTDEGYVIPSDERKEAFTAILSAYGLNETEINDFCEFWCEKLDAGVDYAMYPQLTETVDAVMPVEVTPAPDTTFRIWFAFAPEEMPQRESVPTPFERSGFTMVEWGGLILTE